MEIKKDFSLKYLNTFRIDATARFFVEFKNDYEVIDFAKNRTLKNERRLILNGGSNILFKSNFDGLVIKISMQGIEKTGEDKNHVLIKAGAGISWDKLVEYCIGHNYSGLENLSAIPGNAGAAPIQNIGAYGVEQKDCFYSLEAVHIETGIIKIFNAAECNFGYRESIFKKQVKDEYIILSVTYQLSKTPVFRIDYGAIKAELKKQNLKNVTIKAVSKAICNIRSSKLPNPDEIGSAGSFFKNPMVDQKKYLELKNKFPEIVAYPNDLGKYKIAAGWLIDQMGWKGYRRGDSGVCKTQALVLINYGSAKGEEIYSLATDIQQSVLKHFGLQLEPEVNIIK